MYFLYLGLYILLFCLDSLNKNNDTSTPVKVRNFQKKEIEVMPHLKEKYSFFKGETLSPKQTLYNNRSLENRIQTEKTTTKDDLDIDIIPKKRKFTNSKSKEKYDFLTTHQ